MTPSTPNRSDTACTNDAPEQNPRSERDYPEWTNTRSRSRRPHRCITIRRGGPASGRPRGTPRAVDLDRGHFQIVSGWLGC